MNPWMKTDKPIVIAHRGYCLTAPENTMIAYQKAIEVGADMIEADVNITKDGVLVMIHDHYLDRTINATGSVSDYTWEEIQKMDAGVKFSPEFTGTKIPTAEAFIELILNAGILCCIEIKGGDIPTSKKIAEKVVELIRKHQAFNVTTISSYFPEATAYAKSLDERIVVAREKLPDDKPFIFTDVMDQITEANSPILMFNFHIIQQEDVDYLHTQNIALWAWNPYTESEINQVLDMGIDGVMGDNPELALKLIRQRHE